MYKIITYHSTTKSALAFGLLLAYNHAHSTFDPSPLVLLGGCALAGVRLWALRVGSVDPFLTSQSAAWRVLTSLSVTHPHREVGIMSGGQGGLNIETTSKQKHENESSSREKRTMAKKANGQHLKHD